MATQGNVFAQDTVDRGPWYLWDRALIQAAGTTLPTEIQFFSIPIGAVPPGALLAKTKSDTNLVGKGNSLDPPKKLDVSCIGWIVAGDVSETDIINLTEQYYFEFKIGEKVFVEGLTQLHPAGGGVWASMGAGTLFALGLPSDSSSRRFPDYPRTIPPNVYFGVQLKTGGAGLLLTNVTGSTGIRVTCILDGIIDRAVQ
jgi:hypothetical protein